MPKSGESRPIRKRKFETIFLGVNDYVMSQFFFPRKLLFLFGINSKQSLKNTAYRESLSKLGQTKMCVNLLCIHRDIKQILVELISFV